MGQSRSSCVKVSSCPIQISGLIIIRNLVIYTNLQNKRGVSIFAALSHSLRIWIQVEDKHKPHKIPGSCLLLPGQGTLGWDPRSHRVPAVMVEMGWWWGEEGVPRELVGKREEGERGARSLLREVDRQNPTWPISPLFSPDFQLSTLPLLQMAIPLPWNRR